MFKFYPKISPLLRLKKARNWWIITISNKKMMKQNSSWTHLKPKNALIYRKIIIWNTACSTTEKMTDEDLSRNMLIILIYVHMYWAKKKTNVTTFPKIKKIKIIFLVQNKRIAIFLIIKLNSFITVIDTNRNFASFFQIIYRIVLMVNIVVSRTILMKLQ